ncbi:MAG: GNAT family N-acetyltransferase [Paracoccaceae bacterium]
MSFAISDLAEGDHDAWRPLWGGYCAFYEKDMPAAVTARTWERLIDPQVPVWGRVIRLGGRIVGFAHHLTHVSTWQITPVCYLEDLFVAPEARGTGAGRALIDDLLSICEAKGWSELYWMTAEDNAKARRIYDHYDKPIGFVQYRLAL